MSRLVSACFKRERMRFGSLLSADIEQRAVVYLSRRGIDLRQVFDICIVFVVDSEKTHGSSFFCEQNA